MGTTPREVLDFWFSEHAKQHWWVKNAAFDEEIRTRFSGAVDEALEGGYSEWTSDSDGALALVILLDQFTRNLFRGSPRSFAGDARALEIAERAIRNHFDEAQPLERRSFLYMPYQHAESLDAQKRAIELFERWVEAHDASSRSDAEGDLTFARRHEEIIRRFGRFPHRNAVLGRTSTPEEVAFLKEPGSSF
jgi:uncharacterized protein (DUF924 family)